MPPDLLVILRRLLKRDSNTRLKAIDDLHSYVSNPPDGDEEVLVEATETWVEFYNRLFIDSTIRVRFTANLIHALFAAKVKKKLAPYLKDLLGVWLCYSFDVSKPANEAFNAAFAGDRKIEALGIFQGNIIETLSDFVLSSTPETLSDARYVEPEEMESNYCRIISSAILALSLLIESLPKEKLMECQESYEFIFDSPSFWSYITYPNAIARKAAYHSITALMQHWPEMIESRLEDVAPALLGNCFKDVEISTHSEMWNAVLLLTRKFPQSWSMASEDVEEPVLDIFLRFLQKGCFGSAAVSYPSLKVLIDNLHGQDWMTGRIQDDVLLAIWKGHESNAVDRTSCLSLLNAYLECTFLLIGRDSDLEHSKHLVATHFVPILDIIVFHLNDHPTVEHKLPTGRAYNAIASRIIKLHANTELFSIVAEHVRSASLAILGETTMSQRTTGFESLADFFASLFATSITDRDVRSSFVSPLLQDSFNTALHRLITMQGHNAGYAAFIQRCMVEFPDEVASSAEATKELDHLVKESLPTLFPSPSGEYLPSILASYFQHREYSLERQRAFEASIVHFIQIVDMGKRDQLLDTFVGEIESGKRRGRFENFTASATMDAYVQELASNAGTDKASVLLSRILVVGQPLVSDIAVQSVMASQMAAIDAAAGVMGTGDASHTPNFELLQPLFARKEYLEIMLAKPELHTSIANLGLLALFTDENRSSQAWHAITTTAISNGLQVELCDAFLIPFWNKVTAVTFPASPTRVVEKVKSLEKLLGTSILAQLLGSDTIHRLNEYASDVRNPQQFIAVIEPVLLAFNDSDDTSSLSNISYDYDGNSSYARLIAIVFGLFQTGSPKVDQATFMNHIVFVESLATEQLLVPSLTNTWKGVRSDQITALRETARSLFIDWAGARLSEQGWLVELTRALQNDTPPKGVLAKFMSGLSKLVSAQSPQWARAFVTTLTALIDLAAPPMSDVEGLLQLVKLQPTPENLPLNASLLLVTKSSCLELPKYQRIINELASRLSGVAPAKMSTDGFFLITLLNISAPSNDSPVIFLPSQRAIFLLQGLKKWYSEDGLVSSRTEAQVLLLLNHLAPVVQSLGGAHWEFIMERILSSLSKVKAAELDILLLSSVLELLDTVRTLSQQSDIITESLTEYKEDLDDRLLDIFLSPSTLHTDDKIYSRCLEVIADVVSTVPVSSLTRLQAFDPLCRQFSSVNRGAQVASYQLLRRIVSHTTDDLTVEVAVSKAKDLDVRLPASLMQVIVAPPNEDDPFGYLLAWNLVLDHIEPAIHNLRAFYIEQLREEQAVDLLLPYLLDVLQVSASGKPFDCAKWSVDEFLIQQYDAQSEITASVLACYLYYRLLKTLPGLVRHWWSENRNRGLAIAIDSYTEKFFSPHIIESELAFLSRDEGKAQIQDENMSVKVAKTTHEVTAIYTIDEAPMEMMIRLPKNYPLQQAEVKDVKRIGVPEAKWRYWLLATQQVITAQNGSIIDALNLFKRNISLHFEGVEDCAICYSIINVSDKSLPSKICRVCKHKFHAMCLLRWFKTGNSASCPLCRSSF